MTKLSEEARLRSKVYLLRSTGSPKPPWGIVLVGGEFRLKFRLVFFEEPETNGVFTNS